MNPPALDTVTSVEAHASIRWGRVAAYAGGGIAAALGLIVMAGWLARITPLVQLPGGYGTMQISAALGFLFCGTGLLAAARDKPLWAGLSGALAALVGGATLFEYLTGASLAAELSPVEPFVTALRSAPARMSPIAAANFVVAGAGLLFSAGRLSREWQFLTLTTAGAVVIAVAGLARAGVLYRLGGPTGDSILPGMALQTAIGFTLVGAGIVGMGVTVADSPGQHKGPAAGGQFRPAITTPLPAFGLPILGIGLLLASIAMFLFTVRQSQEADARVRHTLSVINALGRMDQAIANQEAGYRGYVITGQENFLQPYHVGLRGFTESYEEARWLTRDNPEQQRQLEVVRALVVRLNDFADKLIELRKGAAGASRSSQLVAGGTGRALIDGLQIETDRAKGLEYQLLLGRKSREVAIRGMMTATLLLCLLGGILASATQFLLTRRLESQRVALQEEVARRHSAEQRYRTVLDQTPQSILVSDSDGRILEVNSETAAEFGYSREELIGQSGALLVPKRALAARAERRLEILGELKMRSLGPDLVCVRKDGTEFPAMARVHPIQTPDEPQFITSLVNISERRQIEDRLEQAHQTAQAANKELEAFAYSVSHDLRAPLRGMTGFAEILREEYGPRLDDEAQGYLDRIQAATKRMGDLIDDLLALSRVTRSPLNRAQVDLSLMAKEVLEEVRQEQPREGVTFEIQPDLVARCDPRLLRAMLVNLIANAWKFTSKTAHPRIEVGSQRTEGETAYFVRDNGAGFDMAYAGKLFGAFQRLHNTDEFPGTGIGLATAQRIVARHGGRIWAEAKVGAGATFYFTL